MAHALRHAYGMDLAMGGVPLSVIQQLLGHDDPRTTSIYTAAHAEDLSAALADAGVRLTGSYGLRRRRAELNRTRRPARSTSSTSRPALSQARACTWVVS